MIYLDWFLKKYKDNTYRVQHDYTQKNIIYYKLDNYYAPKFENGILYNDKDLKINWPNKNMLISKKDYKTRMKLIILSLLGPPKRQHIQFYTCFVSFCDIDNFHKIDVLFVASK